MKNRAAVSIALAAALGVGLTGCNFISPQRTTTIYAPADGVQASLGTAEVRNLMIIAKPEEGETSAKIGNLVGAAQNTTDDENSLRVAIDKGSTTTVELEKSPKLTKLGAEDGTTVIVEGEFIPGTLVSVTITPSAGGQSQVLQVPVLDDTLKEYSTLVPTQSTQTSTPTSTPTPTGTPVDDTIVDEPVAPAPEEQAPEGEPEPQDENA